MSKAMASRLHLSRPKHMKHSAASRKFCLCRHAEDSHDVLSLYLCPDDAVRDSCLPHYKLLSLSSTPSALMSSDLASQPPVGTQLNHENPDTLFPQILGTIISCCILVTIFTAARLFTKRITSAWNFQDCKHSIQAPPSNTPVDHCEDLLVLAWVCYLQNCVSS